MVSVRWQPRGEQRSEDGDVGAIPPGQSEEIALASCRSRYARAAAGPRQARPQSRTDAPASGALSGRAAEAASEDGEEHRRRAAGNRRTDHRVDPTGSRNVRRGGIFRHEIDSANV